MPENPDFQGDKAEVEHNYNVASHLFLVRLWTESNNEGDAVWCGKVQHITRGRANQFRDWPALIDHFTTMLPSADRATHHTAVEE